MGNCKCKCSNTDENKSYEVEASLNTIENKEQHKVNNMSMEDISTLDNEIGKLLSSNPQSSHTSLKDIKSERIENTISIHKGNSILIELEPTMEISKERIGETYITLKESFNHQLPSGLIIGEIGEIYGGEKNSHNHNQNLLPPKGSHSFLGAVRIAWEHDRTFVLNPDDIWLLIAQGFGKHLQHTGYGIHAQYTSCFTDMNRSLNSRRSLRVRDPNNNPHNAHNNNNTHSTHNNTNIEKRVLDYMESILDPGLADLLEGDFSTTGTVQRICTAIVSLHRVERQSVLRVDDVCCIPAFLLQGVLTDWIRLKAKLSDIANYCMQTGIPSIDWWFLHLTPILDQIILVYQGAPPNHTFWNSFYKIKKGGVYNPYVVSGWVVNFFPYLTSSFTSQLYKNEGVGRWEMEKSVGENDFPSGLLTMPVNLTDMCGALVEEGSLVYRLAAGFCGVAQEGTGVRPLQGWAVVLEDLNIELDNYS